MSDQRDLLEVLKRELDFLEKGGYRNPAKQAWRYQYLFEDSPTCANYGRGDKATPCTECALVGLVPKECRDNPIPCRDIPLNTQGEALRQLYVYADQEEIERKYAAWLKSTIARLTEESRAKSARHPNAA